MITLEYLNRRIENLEKAFLQSQINNVSVTENADKATRIDEYTTELNNNIIQNGSDIVVTMEGLAETSETVDVNSSDIDTCMAAITELYEMIGE